jgi:hypothetical protein
VREEKQEKEELVMYWHISYWDRPLEGVAMYKGRPVYFKLIEDDDEEDDGDEDEEDGEEKAPKYDEPTYALHALTDAQYRELEDQHNEFGRLVGRHTDHRPGVYAPYNNNTDKGIAGVREWYESAANWKLSFCPTRHCPLVAIKPWTAFANYSRPTSPASEIK